MSTSSSSAAVAVFSQSRIRRVIVAIVVACSLLFAGVVAAERSYADTAPSQLHADAIRNQVFNLLNAERASQGRNPLTGPMHGRPRRGPAHRSSLPRTLTAAPAPRGR